MQGAPDKSSSLFRKDEQARMNTTEMLNKISLPSSPPNYHTLTAQGSRLYTHYTALIVFSENFAVSFALRNCTVSG